MTPPHRWRLGEWKGLGPGSNGRAGSWAVAEVRFDWDGGGGELGRFGTAAPWSVCRSPASPEIAKVSIATRLNRVSRGQSVLDFGPQSNGPCDVGPIRSDTSAPFHSPPSHNPHSKPCISEIVSPP